MTPAQFLTATADDLLRQRREADRRDLIAALRFAAEHNENDGADRLRRWAVRVYS